MAAINAAAPGIAITGSTTLKPGNFIIQQGIPIGNGGIIEIDNAGNPRSIGGI
jgi:hypothetical protein